MDKEQLEKQREELRKMIDSFHLQIRKSENEMSYINGALAMLEHLQGSEINDSNG